ncbi:MAG: hypothetical protein AAF596_05545 [Planctomycetota bacterium]
MGYSSIESRPPADPALSQAVEHKGQHFRGLASLWDESLGARRYRSAKGLMPDGADLFMPMLHGMGPITSHAGSMLATLNALTASKKNKSRSQSLKALRRLPGYRVLGAEAIDLPATHGDPVLPRCADLAGICDWLIDWLTPVKQAIDAPIVPIARSASAMLVLGVADRCPDLIDGIVFLSPMAPFDAEHSNADLLRRVAAEECVLNQTAFDYMNSLTTETDWDQQRDPFNGKPTLILTGELDTQVSPRVRRRCAEWAGSLRHVDFEDVADAGHDVFNLRNRPPALAAYGRLYSFLVNTFGRPPA